MRLASLVAFSLLAVGCAERESAKAIRAYEMIDANRYAGIVGVRSEKCRAAGRVKSAFLNEGDAKEYENWSLTEESDCLSASIFPGG